VTGQLLRLLRSWILRWFALNFVPPRISVSEARMRYRLVFDPDSQGASGTTSNGARRGGSAYPTVTTNPGAGGGLWSLSEELTGWSLRTS